jgi:aminopeptidase N
VPLLRPLQPEARVTISLTFDVEIPQRETGYVLFGLSQDVWSLPGAYPLLAVHDGQRWREEIAPAHGDPVFAEAALYEVTLDLPLTLTLATTGSVLTATQSAEGRRIYHIVAGPLREFAWLASPDYQLAEMVAQGVTVRSYYLPGDGAAGQAALNTAAAALRAYASAFGPYPFPEMTVVEAPLSFYGMEYPGLNLIGLDLYRDLRPELEIRVAHEIAHQWWYAQVGNDPIQVPWLDEGLAEYSTAIYYRQVYGPGRANALVNQRWLVPYQALVEDGLDAVVNQPAAAFGEEYEVIVYAKAALFFDALSRELGPETLAQVLQVYVNRYRWQVATPEEFLAVAESVSGRDLDGLYNRWILSRQ